MQVQVGRHWSLTDIISVEVWFKEKTANHFFISNHYDRMSPIIFNCSLCICSHASVCVCESTCCSAKHLSAPFPLEDKMTASRLTWTLCSPWYLSAQCGSAADCLHRFCTGRAVMLLWSESERERGMGRSRDDETLKRRRHGEKSVWSRQTGRGMRLHTLRQYRHQHLTATLMISLNSEF